MIHLSNFVPIERGKYFNFKIISFNDNKISF